MSLPHKILVIDDSRLVAVMLQDGLQHEGYEVMTAANGREGLGKVAEGSPDLIILDVQMPGMSGYEFMHEMARMGGRCDIPVLMLTADEASGDLGMEQGIKGYFQKPVNISDLAQKVKECLGQSGGPRS